MDPGIMRTGWGYSTNWETPAFLPLMKRAWDACWKTDVITGEKNNRHRLIPM
jgi:hypothetical protein